MENKGHFCYGCNEYFHDSNPIVNTHKNCKGNKSLGICVDSREFKNIEKIKILESLIDLNNEEIRKEYMRWDKGDCSEVGLCEILLFQLIKEHKEQNGEYYNTDYDQIKLRYGVIKSNKNMKKIEITNIRQRFIDLISEEKILYIEQHNHIEYDIKPFYIYKTNEIELNFMSTDHHGDDTTFFAICYNEDKKKWHSENCIDFPEILFNTYEEMKNHVKTIENDIINNGFNLAKFI